MKVDIKVGAAPAEAIPFRESSDIFFHILQAHRDNVLNY